MTVLVLPGFTWRGATMGKAEDAAPDGANNFFRLVTTYMSRLLALQMEFPSG
jgi:hypothetical protein